MIKGESRVIEGQETLRKIEAKEKDVEQLAKLAKYYGRVQEGLPQNEEVYEQLINLTLMLKEHKKALDGLADSTNVHADVLHLLPGRAHEILPAFAIEQDASLVVMGALARSKMRQRIIGSTAARALDHIHCDVLVAHGKRA